MMPPNAEKERRLVYALRVLAEQTSSEQPSAELEQKLLSAVRRSRSTRPVRWAWVTAVAAAIVLLVSMPSVFAPRQAGAPVQDITSAAIAPLAETDADALTPWYVDETLPAAESGNVVRMEVTRTAAMQYGAELPASAAPTVQAEMFIGDDGVARAIRIVR